MASTRPFDLVVADAAAARLDAALAFLRASPRLAPITIVGASRGAADDLARRFASEQPATVGVHRFSLTQLAARLAAATLSAQGLAPASALGAEAVAVRAIDEARQAGTLARLGPIAGAPGFPRALARTLAEVREGEIDPGALAVAGGLGVELAGLACAAAEQYLAAGTTDRARLLVVATEVLQRGGPDATPVTAGPVVLLDLEMASEAEARFVAAVAAAARGVLATSPAADRRAHETLVRAGGRLTRLDEPAGGDISAVRAHLFRETTAPSRVADGTVTFFSAPGEARECVEMARRVLAEARRGVPFDEIAILVRAPQVYQGLLEDALVRAGIPAWFDRGTARPELAGRAFLALLACADERLSARRFAEYLSLGQVPSAVPSDDVPWTPSADDAVGVDALAAEASGSDAVVRDRADAAFPPSVNAPRRWDRMLVEAAVVGGDPARWRRRLEGLAAEFDARLASLQREDPESSRVESVMRDRAHLAALSACALPLVTEMAAWPRAASWGEWIEQCEALAPRVLRDPTPVLRVLADLRPMARVGPVPLADVRRVLGSRLGTIAADPPARRYGRVFVGTPAHARGRSFRVVFVPGLAERLFPQRTLQDPLLPDRVRAVLGSVLPTGADLAGGERLLLQIAAGAAGERLYASYPRFDASEARARVPSFYALDLLRGVTGHLPDYQSLAAAAADAGGAALAWPAPLDPAEAIDDQEHDIAVLRRALDAGDPQQVRGHARYLLDLNPSLRRSVTERWGQAERRWSQLDGLVRVTDGTRAPLAALRLTARAYSVSALQRFARCPYQFFLAAAYRLHPPEPIQPLQRLDPLTRGSIVHRIQALVLRDLRDRGDLPVRLARLAAAAAVLDRVVAAVSAEWRERLAPAVDRVWRDEVASVARDLRGWLDRMAADQSGWTPTRFEFAFGLAIDADHDASSTREPARLDARYTLRGSVDLIEEDATGALRVTDHKTGRDRTRDGLVVGGGQVLQPVLYAAAVEQVTGQPVRETRLSFCTVDGRYGVRPVPLTESTRRAGIEVLEIVDRAIEQGRLAPAPSDGACVWCEFRTVCGPGLARRVARKPREPLLDLRALRSRP